MINDRVKFNPLKISEKVIFSFQSQIKFSFITECWEWTGSKLPFGYGGGVAKSPTIRRGKRTLAHQLSWIIYYGDIPDGMEICHKCDNPSCVNPNHLYLGTSKDNAKDRVNRRRNGNQNGENNSQSKLDYNKVYILIKDGYRYKSCKEWSDELGVSCSTVSQIVNRRRWKWLK